MIRPMKTLAILALVVCVPLAACNTVKGAGKDVSAVGKGVSGAATSAGAQ